MTKLLGSSEYLKIKKTVLFSMLLLFLFALVVPEEWESGGFILFAPLSFIADYIPSISMMSEVSLMPGVVRGVFAASWLIFAVDFFIIICISLHGFNGVRDRILSNVEGKKFVFFLQVSVFPWLACSALVYFLAYLPMVDISLSPGNTKGQLLFSLMLTNRFFMGCAVVLAAFNLVIFTCGSIACLVVGFYKFYKAIFN